MHTKWFRRNRSIENVKVIRKKKKVDHKEKRRRLKAVLKEDHIILSCDTSLGEENG
jgi:hypothetical protein